MLIDWLLNRFNPTTGILNLAYDPNVGALYGHKVYLLQFLANPTPFLNEYGVTGISLRNNVGMWNPKKELHTLLQHSSMIFLDLSKNDLDDEDVAKLATLKNLRSLHLGHNHITDKGVNCFAGNQTLQELNFEHNHIGLAGATTLSELPSLRKINVAGNAIGEEGGWILAKNLTDFTYINLKKTHIGHETAKELVKHIPATRPKNFDDFKNHPELLPPEIHVSTKEVGCHYKWIFMKANSTHYLIEKKQQRQLSKNPNHLFNINDKPPTEKNDLSAKPQLRSPSI